MSDTPRTDYAIQQGEEIPWLCRLLERALAAERKAREEAKPIAYLYYTRYGNKLLSFTKYDDPSNDYTNCVPLYTRKVSL